MGEYLEPEQVDNIIGAYFVFNGRLVKASKELGHIPNTVARYWKLLGFEFGGSFWLFGDDLIDTLLCYEGFDGDLKKSADKLGIPPASVSRRWKKLGLRVVRHRYYRGCSSFEEYVRRNAKEIRKLGRKGLALSDFGLYRTALRRGIMNELIPEKGKPGRKSIESRI